MQTKLGLFIWRRIINPGKKAAKVGVSKDGAVEDEVAIAGAAKDGVPIGRIGSSSTDNKSL